MRTFLKMKTLACSVLGLLVFVGFYFSIFYHTILPSISQFEAEKVASNIEHFRFYPKIELPEQQQLARVDDLITDGLADIVQSNEYDMRNEVERAAQRLARQYKFDFTTLHAKTIVEAATLFNVSFSEDKLDGINKPIMTSGMLPTDLAEVAVGIGYARANHLEIGATITLNDKIYKVVGIYYDLGNTYVFDPALSKTVFSQDNASVLLHKSAYDKIDANDNIVYLGRFKTDDTDIEIKVQEMLDRDDFISIVSSDTVASRNMLEMTLNAQLTMMYLGIILLFVVMIIFISSFVGSYMKKSKKQLGTLIAMGYKKSQLLASYVCFPLLFFIFIMFGSILGYTGRSLILAQLELVFNYPFGTSQIEILPLLAFDILYVIFVGVFMLTCVYIALRVKPLDLITRQKRNKKTRLNAITRSVISLCSFKQHIKYAFALANIGRLMTMIGCVSGALILINVGLSLYGGFHQGIEMFDRQTNFAEIVAYKNIKLLDEGEDYAGKFFKTTGFLSEINEQQINRTVDFEFVDFNTVPINLTADGEKDGVFVPVRYKYSHDVSIGDTITIKGVQDILRVPVIGFNDLSVNNTFYITRILLPDYDKTLTSTSFNGAYVQTKAEVGDNYDSLRSKTSVVKQMKDLQQNSSGIVLLLISFSLLAAFVLVYTISGANVSDAISGMVIMLLAGYKTKTISSLLLNVYSSAIVIGGLLAMLILPNILELTTKMINTTDIGFIQLSFNLVYFSLAFLAVVSIYHISLLLTRRRYLKLNIREVMSDE